MNKWTKIGGGGRDWKFWGNEPSTTARMSVERLHIKPASYESVRKDMLLTCVEHENKWGSWENPAWLMNRDDVKWVIDRLGGGE